MVPIAVVRLNRAVAIGMAFGPESALPLLDELEPELPNFHLLHATRGDFLRRIGRAAEAKTAFERAYALATTDTERRFLQRRIDELT